MKPHVLIVTLAALSPALPAGEVRLPDPKTLLGLPPVPVPKDNPLTLDKARLGRKLFEDKRFSADGTVSCAHCHKPELAFQDGLPVSEGIRGQKGTRNAPTVINAAYYTRQFWDGRRPSLEAQAKDPFVNPIEHGLKSHDPIVEIVRGDPDYRNRFRQAFGLTPDQITIDHVVQAIASFERTVVAGDSPFDRYLYGGDKNALSEAAIRGLAVFRGKGRCVSCHVIEESTALFTDNRFHNLGVGFERIQARLPEIIAAFRKAKAEGRPVDEAVLTQAELSELGQFAVTGETEDIGKFKTSTLRNIALTAPYMHDGSLKTLEEVIDFYDISGFDNPLLDGGIRPLGLTPQEKTDLVEFLKSLTSSRLARRTP
ncbi:cytochrome c peroxidase [Methylomarinovum caldicuralii]|uniref:Cytochrome c peroxidase n=1 Tax=Methylomarinovum caldicuralii TaxID=438856 RepID=A0AAU9C3P2_9GAMM|nr:cytochrome c peroxidase [Methylomarinovum caldicuralii]BCX81774.1 cytochrome c peroxidase [Methylomarinovum caldicuralii]